MTLDGQSTLWALFLSAFISATLLPGGSEAVLAALSHGKFHDPLVLLTVATLGNTLGGMTSWVLGRALALRVPMQDAVDRHRAGAIHHLQRWGSPLLLLSWVPVIGDPLCFAAGWLRVRWWLALVFIATGKAARYLAVIAVFQ